MISLSFEEGRPLDALLSEDGAIPEQNAAPIVLQLARALRHCHAKKIAHRDVKLDNVIYDKSTGRAVLIDFGLALIVRTHGSRLEQRCGSHLYSAPEMLDQASKGYYGPAVDMWALGVVAYVLLCAQFPFGSERTKIARGSYDKQSLEKAKASSSARDFVASALVVDPNSAQKVNRISSADACKHAWLRPHEPAASAITAPPLPMDEISDAVRDAAQRAAAAGGVSGADDEDSSSADAAPSGATACADDDEGDE